MELINFKDPIHKNLIESQGSNTKPCLPVVVLRILILPFLLKNSRSTAYVDLNNFQEPIHSILRILVSLQIIVPPVIPEQFDKYCLCRSD